MQVATKCNAAGMHIFQYRTIAELMHHLGIAGRAGNATTTQLPLDPVQEKVSRGHGCGTFLMRSVYVKDQRRRIPVNGWAYFTLRYLTDEGNLMYDLRNPAVEILFSQRLDLGEVEYGIDVRTVNHVAREVWVYSDLDEKRPGTLRLKGYGAGFDAGRVWNGEVGTFG
ncbi:hypothetical protein BDV32DRAFT_144275 [Aspergillus pseudonomiae]|nr:hypothetical protein BDV32DRAFT_144275 [Aspergillus pseudonomiae]